MTENDIVSDILQRVAARTRKLPAAVAAELEREIRKDWGGERHYIAKQGEDGRRELSLRNARILADYRRGAHEELLARRHGVTVRRIRQIIALDNAARWA